MWQVTCVHPVCLACAAEEEREAAALACVGGGPGHNDLDQPGNHRRRPNSARRPLGEQQLQRLISGSRQCMYAHQEQRTSSHVVWRRVPPHVQDTCACPISLIKATRPPKEQLCNTVRLLCLSRLCVQTQACPLPDDKIVIYGGEDGHRRPLAEAHVLDLQVGAQAVSLLLQGLLAAQQLLGHPTHVHDPVSVDLFSRCCYLAGPAGVHVEED